MNPPRLAFLMAIPLFLGACRRPCTQLRERVCGDLGPRCSQWQSLGYPGLPTGDQHENSVSRSASGWRLATALGLSEEGGDVCLAIDEHYEPFLQGIRASLGDPR